MSSSMSESASASASASSGMTIDIRPMIEDVSQVMTKHITNILSGVIGEYTIYKETHDTIMGLPCVRKLQARILELEQQPHSLSSSSSSSSSTAPCSSGSGSGSGGNGASREDEVAQLQSAIAELNRYIHALESKVDVKSAMSLSERAMAAEVFVAESESESESDEEESVRLEIQEHTDDGGDTAVTTEENIVLKRNCPKNVIISPGALHPVVEEEVEEDPEAAAEAEMALDDEAEEEEAGEAEEEEAGEEAEEEAGEEEEEEAEEAEEEAGEAEEEEAVEEEGDAEEEEAEEEEAVEEEEDEGDAEEEEEAGEEEDEAVDDAQQQQQPEADDEIEVSEVTIKGKTYFTTDPVNGIIYACVDDDVGDEVGVFKNGVAVFNKTKK